MVIALTDIPTLLSLLSYTTIIADPIPRRRVLSGCEKIDVNKLEGTWSEQYDPTVFAMDGSVTFTFDGNNGYQLHVYDALSGESHDYSGHYTIDLINKGTITINPAMSDDSYVTYKLVKLTSKEMEWQKEGTTYSVGMWGSDYRHFIKGKKFVLFTFFSLERFSEPP